MKANRTSASAPAVAPKPKLAPGTIVEWELWAEAVDYEYGKLLDTAKLFERWADQLRRMAALKSGEPGPEARN